MSIADKLIYLNTTKEKLKDSINALGGDITDNTTFRQYADKLQNVYDILPKTDYAEGSNITLSNTLKGKLDFEDGIVGYGQTSQEGTPTPDSPQDIEVVTGTQTITIANSDNTETQTYQLSLGEYEFAKIGNYVDTIEYDVENDKVYKNEKIGKKIYTGESSENWSIWQGIILIDDTTIKNLGTSNSNFYLNYFRNVSSIAYIGSNTGQRLHIQLSNAGLSEITSVSAWKTWLSTHNLEFVYVCNETLTEITGTLADQVKALYYSHSFTGTTIITSNGELPLVLKVRALKGE